MSTLMPTFNSSSTLQESDLTCQCIHALDLVQLIWQNLAHEIQSMDALAGVAG
jgi:hypothetical protein